MFFWCLQDKEKLMSRNPGWNVCLYHRNIIPASNESRCDEAQYTEFATSTQS